MSCELGFPSVFVSSRALLPVCLIFLICILAETKRVPFDLPEAEAELVAGYNVEYSLALLPVCLIFLLPTRAVL